jgi:hypothetical protein
MGSDMSEVAARPRDPSVDSFIDRYGVWNTQDQIKKDEEDARIADEVSRSGRFKAIKPGTKTWPSGNVISDAADEQSGTQTAQMTEPTRLRDKFDPEVKKYLEMGLRAVGLPPGGDIISMISDLAKHYSGDLMFPQKRLDEYRRSPEYKGNKPVARSGGLEATEKLRGRE